MTTRTPSPSRITRKPRHHAGRRGAVELPSDTKAKNPRAKDGSSMEGDAGQVVVDVAANKAMARTGWIFAGDRLVRA